MGKDFAIRDIFKAKIKKASIEEMLSKIPVFETLEVKELRHIAAIVHRRKYSEGEYVFFQGDPGLGMYVIERGKVAIVLMGKDDSEKELTELKTGDFFGEIALLDESPRSASVKVKEDSKLIGFFRPDLFSIIQNKPETGLKIITKLAEMIGERLRNTNNELSKARAELEMLKSQIAKETKHEKAATKEKKGTGK